MTRDEERAAGFTAARPRLTAIAHAVVGNHAEGEDIVSGTWLRLRPRARAGQVARPTNGHTMSTGTNLAIRRTGTGAPLVLLHALGSSSHSWEPVLPYLVDGFEVLAVDLPGFGASPAPADSEQATPAALAAAVDAALSEAGIHDPHVVGNSLGGWVALELAQIRPVATLTLLSPAGMWAGNTPWYCRLSLRGTRGLAKHAERLLDRLVEHRLGRIVALGQTHGHPTRVTPDQARAAIHEMASCTGFDAALQATAHLHYRRPDDDRAQPPTTVAFGSRDRLLLLRQWRRSDELPVGAVEARLPGCGHIPMYDDPAAVARVITETTGAWPGRGCPHASTHASSAPSPSAPRQPSRVTAARYTDAAN